MLSPLGEQNDQPTRFGSQCFWFLIRRSFVIICGIVVVDQIWELDALLCQNGFSLLCIVECKLHLSQRVWCTM